ncbi:MAG: hypothetical protein Q4B17_13475 [Lautropia sp.]|nr:hypothetical protein [Lautropia sp.]
MSETALEPAVLGRVLAEVKAIQATAIDDTVVWFGAQNIADACGLPVEDVTQALGCLHQRGDVVTAFSRGESPRARLKVSYALAEAVENSNERPEAE